MFPLKANNTSASLLCLCFGQRSICSDKKKIEQNCINKVHYDTTALWMVKNDEEEFKGKFVSQKEIQFYILGHIPNKVSGKFLDAI